MPVVKILLDLEHIVKLPPIEPGQSYGTVTVVEAAPDYIHKDGRHEKRWICKYDCGHTITVYQSKLREGYNHQCSICSAKNSIDSMIGQKFNRLTVLSKGDDYVNGNKRETQYVCLCECGNIKTVKGTYLRSGHTKSCGCLQQELTIIANNKRYISNMNNKVVTLPSSITPLKNSIPGVTFLTDEEINNILDR